MQKVTRADLEQQGFHVAEVGEEESIQPEIRTAGSIGDDTVRYYTAEGKWNEPQVRQTAPPQYRSKADDDAKLFMKVATLALKVLALRVLLFGAGGMASLLFYQVVQNPDQAKIASAVLFTVLVFLPTLYYSSKTT
jgi:hypothetical protein